ncbi:MAG: protein translocase subunit SecD [Gemmatimonadota bacterium]
MFGSLKGRIILILVVVAAAAGVLIANGLKLGLDLQGGMYLALEVEDPQHTLTEQARRDATDQALEVIRNRMDQFGVAEPLIQKVGDDRIVVQLPGIRDEARAKAIIERTAFLEFSLVKDARDFMNALPRMDRAIIAAGFAPAADTTADTARTTGPSPMELLFEQQRDSARIAADTAARDTAADALLRPPGDRASPLSGLLLESGNEGEFVVAEPDVSKVKQYLALPEVQRLIPRGTALVWGNKPLGRGAELYRSLFVLEDESFMKGSALSDATAGRDPQFGQTMVYFQLNRRGGRTFERVTGSHIGDRIAIVLDNQVHSAPTVQGQIGANGQIELGQSPMEEARDLALVLRAGALPAPVEIVDQRSVGPSLGQDSIDQGKLAGIVGVLAIILIMVGVYRLAGVLSVIALGTYLVLVLGGLAAFGATLTAPGIAGLILSLGMAVDANVLIFERIREELEAGRTNRQAVDEGFHQAMSAIVDSNLTTLITALILFQIGTGPVRGFAVTLAIGILASFFSAVFVTKTLFMIYIARRGPAEPLSI